METTIRPDDGEGSDAGRAAAGTAARRDGHSAVQDVVALGFDVVHVEWRGQRRRHAAADAAVAGASADAAQVSRRARRRHLPGVGRPVRLAAGIHGVHGRLQRRRRDAYTQDADDAHAAAVRPIRRRCRRHR